MNQGSGQNCWITALSSPVFASSGLPWLYHARRYPGIRLLVADVGLNIQHRRKLLEENVGLLLVDYRTHFDMWAAILNANVSEGAILYTAPSDLLDPIPIFSRGADKMVFGKWPVESEYYNLCSPVAMIANRAKTANYIEENVAKKMGGIAAPVRLCGPAYLWKVMVGLTHAVRAAQPFNNEQPWEPLAANLFAAAYPEYTFLEA